MGTERQKLLNDYAATSRAFADAVEKLRSLHSAGEAFISALAEVGTARRSSERSRIRLEKDLYTRIPQPIQTA